MTTLISTIPGKKYSGISLHEELSFLSSMTISRQAEPSTLVVESSERVPGPSAISRKRAQQMIEANEDIRRHIARELHDDIGQRLSLLSIRLGLLKQLDVVDDPDDNLAGSLRDLDTLISDVHDLSHTLHSSRIEHLGLASALREVFSRFLVSYGTQIDFFEGNLPDRLPPGFALCFFRIAQESVSNAIKHGGASNIRVALKAHHKMLSMQVQDFGAGFDKKLVQEGLGLITMEERMAAIGGTLTVESELDVGTMVIAVANLLP